MSRFLGRQSPLWCFLFGVWIIWAVCWMLVSPVYAAWETGYTHRKTFTIQHANMDSDLTHFPLLIKTVDADVDDNCDDDGIGSWDIMFTTSDGSTDLDIDWQDYSEAGGEATIIAYVSQAAWTINADGSTYGYMYYENAAAGDPGTAEGVWDANFMAVWHLNEASGGPYLDATSNNNDSDGGTMPDQVAGKVAYAQDFELASSEYITVADSNSLDLGTNDFTITSWVNRDDTDNDHYIVVKRQYGSGAGYYLYGSSGDDPYSLIHDGTDAAGADSVDNLCGASAWHQAGILCDRSESDGFQIIQDGGISSRTSDPTAVDSLANTRKLGLGCRDAQDPGTYMNGLIDEVRVSSTLRAAAWIKFEHANIDEADAELTWGSEESESASFIPTIIIFAGHSGMGLCLIVFRKRKKK